jgi:hypothetical protein
MMNDARPAPPPFAACRYPLLGGAAAWYLPLLATALAAAAAAGGHFEVAIGAAALAWAAHRLTRSVVVEVSPTGLTRGFVSVGAFRARTTVMAWAAVVEVRTEWCGPGNDVALQTAVRDREGHTIRLSTAMGLAAYWTCLGEIVRCAPAAARSGLTDRVLAEAPPGCRHVLSAAGLALVLIALVTVHSLWAQGRVSLAGDLEQIGVATERAGSVCLAGAPRDRCR